MPDTDDFWIFGYGSLMWHPGFEHLERVPALLRGYHRAFCISSHYYRGTVERPGLVLGLDRGGSCRGIAYRADAGRRDEVMAYLDDRELTHYVYLQKQLPVALGDGRRVRAHTYVADPDNNQYAGKLPIDELVRLTLQGHGTRGACAEYLENTVFHLDELGIRDGPLHDLLDRVRAAQDEDLDKL
jgi:cation transport protein ChaC